MSATFRLTFIRDEKQRISVRTPPLKIVTVVIIALTAALLYFLPLYLETVISDNLDFNRIKENLASSIKEKTGMTMRIQGARFDLINGIILFGIRIYPDSEISEQTYLIQIESLSIEPSYLNYFRGRPPFESVRIERGRINVDLLGYNSWLNLFQRESLSAVPITDSWDFFHTFFHPEESFNDLGSFQIEASDLTAAFIRSKTHPDLLLDFTAARSREGWRSEAIVYLNGDDGRSPLIRASGSYNSGRRGILFFKMENISPGILHSLIALTPFMPEEFAGFPVVFDDGILTGNGSVSFYGDGIGMNLNADYDGLKLRIVEPLQPFARIEGSGHFSLNAGIETDTGELIFNRIRFEQPEFYLDLKQTVSESKDKKSKLQEISVSGKIDLPEDREEVPALSFADIFGEASFFYSSSHREGAPVIAPQAKISFSNLRIYPPEGLLSGAPGQRPVLITGRGHIELKKDLSLNFSGHLLDSAIEIRGRSPLRITREQRYGREPEYQLEQKWDFMAEAAGLSYDELFALSSRIHKKILMEGSHQDAKKIEDSGPVWENGFLNRPLYQNWIRLLNLSGDIKLSKMEKRGDLPSDLNFHLSKTGGTMTVQLKAPVPSPALDFNYRLELERQIPQHEFRFNLLTEDNPLSLDLLTGMPAKPKSVEINYAFGGEGIYAGDLVGRTWSSMLLRLGGVDLRDFEPVKILIHRIDRPDLDLYAQSISLTRSTQGPFIQYGSIQIQTPEIAAYGSGNFSYYRGGDLGLNVTLYPSDPQRSVRQNQKLLINGDGTYTPF